MGRRFFSLEQKMQILQDWAKTNFDPKFNPECGLALSTVYRWRRSYNQWGEEGISRPPRAKVQQDLWQIKIRKFYPASFFEFKENVEKNIVKGLGIKNVLELLLSHGDPEQLIGVAPKIEGEPIVFASNISKKTVHQIDVWKKILELEDIDNTKMLEWILYRAYAAKLVIGAA